MLTAMVGRRAVIVDSVRRVAGVIGDLSRGRVVAVFGTPVEAARIEQGSLEPDGPNGGENAEPRRAAHDLENIEEDGRRLRARGIPASLGYVLYALV